jgi:hypothetical protein
MAEGRKIGQSASLAFFLFRLFSFNRERGKTRTVISSAWIPQKKVSRSNTWPPSPSRYGLSSSVGSIACLCSCL